MYRNVCCKLCLTKHYKAVCRFCLLDSMMNLQESRLELLRENTVRLENNKLIYDTDLPSGANES